MQESFNWKELILVTIPFVIACIFAYILWRFLFKSFFGLRGKLSVNIREKVIPDIQKANNYLITLSSSAILLTFSIIQIFSKNIFYKNLLVVSWSGFALCIFVGVIIEILTYIFRVQYLAMLKGFEDFAKTKGSSVDPEPLLDKVGYFEKMLFCLLFLHPIIFFISMVYMILFAVKNI